jgi:CHAT domain-containing protein
MAAFYRHHWTGKLSKADSLWRAKLELRSAEDDQGRPKYKLRDWAAWVLSGDPR